MSKAFISTNDVVASALSKCVINDCQVASFRKAVDKLDISLDGKLDGGFYARQVKKDGTRLSELIGSLFNAPSPHCAKPKTPEKESPVQFGLKMLLGLVLLPFSLAGCNMYHSCIDPVEECPGNAVCSWDDNDIEHCEGCDYCYVNTGDYCEWDYWNPVCNGDYYYDDYYYDDSCYYFGDCYY